MPNPSAKPILEYLVKNIAEKPDEVEIKEEEVAPNTLHYSLSVAQSDMGHVIGRAGNTIRSIRQLARVFAVKNNLRIEVSLQEEPPL